MKDSLQNQNEILDISDFIRIFSKDRKLTPKQKKYLKAVYQDYSHAQELNEDLQALVKFINMGLDLIFPNKVSLK